MILPELKKLIQSRAVTSVVLFIREPPAIKCEVWAYGDDTAKEFGHMLIGGRSGESKTYTSIDRAYKALREMGYTGQVIIDTAQPIPEGLRVFHVYNQRNPIAAREARDGILIDPLLPDGFYDTAHEDRDRESREFWWDRPFIQTYDNQVIVMRLDGGAWDRPTELFWGDTVDEALAFLKRG